MLLISLLNKQFFSFLWCVKTAREMSARKEDARGEPWPIDLIF